MKIRKKALALLMALTMMLSLVPAYALADDEAAAPAAEETVLATEEETAAEEESAAVDEASAPAADEESAVTDEEEAVLAEETVSQEMPTLDATAPAGESFTMERVPGGTQKDVIVNGERRVIYCMQYDYLWPVTAQGYANPQTKYTEAATVDLLNAEQQEAVQRVLYAGYPYDAVGILAPLYANLDAASAADAAADITQFIIWSLMAEWGVEGNSHYESSLVSAESGIPGWDEAYNALVDYAKNGPQFSDIPVDFVPTLTGSATFAKHGDSWKTGALSITNPDGFKVMYHVNVPDDVVLLDKDGYEMYPSWDFVNGGWVNLGYTVYGGDTFYLQTEHGPSVENESISFSGSVKQPTDIKQYLTNDTGLGDKSDGQGYVQHPFQTMLSVGISSASFDGEAALHAAGETVTVSGHKTWIHGDNQQYPTSIPVHLHANGTRVDSKNVTANDGWAWSFDDLPKYDAAGAEIVYTIDEGYVHDYSASYHGYNITNTYTPAKTSINVEKHWDDASDHDGLRPESVTVKLLADGVDTGKTVVLTDIGSWRGVFENLAERNADGSIIVYTVEEVPVDGYTSSSKAQTDAEGRTTGFVITNTHTVEHVTVSGKKTWNHGDNPEADRPTSITVFLHADGAVKATKTVTAADGWKWSFTDLDKYDHGVEIVYTVSEMSVPNYTTAYARDSYDITNTYEPEKTDVSVSKAWNDAHDQDGLRPGHITVNLLANGKATGKTLTLDETNRWEGIFTELNAFDANGERIHYTVTENAVDGYRTVISGSESIGYTITNTHAPALTSVSGSKTWVDDDNQDGKRPASITVHLLADGTPVESVNVTRAENWSWNFTDLPKYDQGTEIVYSVLEDRVDEYSTEYSGYDITNSYTPGQTSVTVEKRWEDDHDRDGKRPESIQVRLLANGVDTGKTLTLDETNRWEGTFSPLDEYKNGQPIVYTVEEITKVEGYSSAVGGDEDVGFIITNSYTPETISISGVKVWDDGDDLDGLRPDSVIIHILANGEKVKALTVSEDTDWAWEIDGLPKNEKGVAIVYTVSEDEVEGYEAEITGSADEGFTVTNKHTPGLRGILTVSKTVKGRNADMDKAFSFTVTLGDKTVNGTYGDLTFTDGVASFTLKDGETVTAFGLPAGIRYTVRESASAGYRVTKTGATGKIPAGGTASAAFTNTKTNGTQPTEPTTPTKDTTSPQTGDNSALTLWFALLLTGSCALAGVFAYGRRKNRFE